MIIGHWPDMQRCALLLRYSDSREADVLILDPHVVRNDSTLQGISSSTVREKIGRTRNPRDKDNQPDAGRPGICFASSSAPERPDTAATGNHCFASSSAPEQEKLAPSARRPAPRFRHEGAELDDQKERKRFGGVPQGGRRADEGSHEDGRDVRREEKEAQAITEV